MPHKDKTIRAEKNKEYLKKHYNANKEYYFQKNIRNRKKNYELLQEIKETLFCEKGGEHRIICLDFHHTNSDEKEMSISVAVHRGWGIKRIKEEIKKCQVVCANCHRIIHSKN